MQTIILAGGKGTRLKPYTTVFPKPLMPVGDLPILEVVIRQLKYYGFTNITMAVGHLKELLQAYFNNGEKWNVDINYSVEEKALGTAAPLKLVKDLEDDFIIMNGDVLSDINYNEFFEFHKSKKSKCTIAVYQKMVKIDLGVLDLDGQNLLLDYIEKPEINYNVSMGIYAFHKSVIDYIPKDQYFDFPDLVKVLLREKITVNGFAFNGYWLDIGRPEDYEMATQTFEKNKERFLK